MPQNNSKLLKEATEILQKGGIIAYPTEGVYGLGCDPFNEKAVTQLAKLKKRELNKGFILIAANWQQVKNLVMPIPTDSLTKVMQTWPGPVTWLFPASPNAPKWITGDHDTIALRVTAHPIAKALALAFDQPIVSTSANYEGKKPANDLETLKNNFAEKVSLIIPGNLGDLLSPTPIYDALTQSRVR